MGIHITTSDQNEAPHLTLWHLMSIFQRILFVIKRNEFEVALE